MSDDDETVRLTYAELAQARGITLPAAKRMTLRHRWAKQIGNDGLARIIVPLSALPAGERPGIGPSASPSDSSLAGPSHDTPLKFTPILGVPAEPTDSPSDRPADGAAVALAAALASAITAATADSVRAVQVLEAAVASLREQLAAANERNTELQAALDLEITEHRRVVAALIEKLSPPAPVRRSWWRWRR
jgi:hypothetical protein